MTFDEVPFTEVLSDIVDNRGKTCPTAATGLPLIATNCIRNESLYPTHEKVRYVDQETYENWFRGHPEPGDLIFVTKGTPGRVCMTPDPVNFCIAQDRVAVRADTSRIDPNYLFAVLRSRDVQRQIENMHVGTMIPHFKKGDFDKLRLLIPDRKSQEFIGKYYRVLSDKIELNRRMNETLEGIARALFKSWFVDFDPVRAKMDGRQPAGMAPEIADLFPSEFEHVNGELVPKGWSIRRVGDVARRVTKGDTPRKEALAAAGENEQLVPMLRVNAITEDGEILKEKFEYIPESVHLGKSKRSILQENDILYTNARTIGRVALVQLDLLPANTNQAIAIVRPNAQEVPPVFLFMQLRQPEFQAELHYDIVQAVQANLALGKIADAVGVFPPPNAINELIGPVASVLEKVWLNRRESASLASLRDNLLPKLLSGELRVPEADKMLEEVL